MQNNANTGCVYLLLLSVVMGLMLWWLNEREQKEEQVRSERWEEWRKKFGHKHLNIITPNLCGSVDSAAAKDMERKIWAVSAQPSGSGRNAPDDYQDNYEDYRDDPEDELRFPPEVFDASDD